MNMLVINMYCKKVKINEKKLKKGKEKEKWGVW